VKIEPLPTWHSTQILPPWSSTNFRARASPTPVSSCRASFAPHLARRIAPVPAHEELVISVTRQHSPSTSRLPAPVLFAARSGRPPARRPFRLCATGCGHRVGVLEGEAEDKTLVVIQASNPLHATVTSRKGAPTSPSAASTWWRACRCTILACRTPPRSAASSSLAGPRPSRERSFEGAQRFAKGAGRHGAAS